MRGAIIAAFAALVGQIRGSAGEAGNDPGLDRLLAALLLAGLQFIDMTEPLRRLVRFDV